jgi:hypothetical protein
MDLANYQSPNVNSKTINLNMKNILLPLMILTVSLICAQPTKVEIKSEKDNYVLLRNGKPYQIKGACAFDHYDKLRAYGGNSIRVWTTEKAMEQLNKAHELGLTITLGLFLKPERLGFDYSNKSEVEKQREQIKREVMKFKDHPALLMWGIGNELELFAKNPKVWDAVNDIAKMIKEIDPNHPVTTMLAGVPENHMSHIIKRCTHLDLLSINVFKDLPYVDQKLQNSGWNGPYLISEWGPDGYWETEPTKWGKFIEESSTIKAEQYKARYDFIKKNSNKCIGSYVFLWGHKQERSHTYFSMILDSGHETEGIDVMQYLWTGKWPNNRAPKIKSALLNGKNHKGNIYLKTGSQNIAEVIIQESANNPLYFYWELIPESQDLRDGGEGETKPPVIVTAISNPKQQKINLIAPEKPGAYRLFVQVYDINGKAATANIPFFVEQ